MKKLAYLLLTLILALGCVFSTGCKDKGGEDEPETSLIPAADATLNFEVLCANVLWEINIANSYISYPGQTGKDYAMDLRYRRFVTLFEYYTPDVLMFQEFNGHGGWWDYFITNEDSFLNTYENFAFLGRKNHMGGSNGNGAEHAFYNQLYYNAEKYELVDGDTFYCRNDRTKPENSVTGDYEGTYTQNGTTTCTWAVLRDRKTKLCVLFATTHLTTRPNVAQVVRNYGQARNMTDELGKIAEQYKWGENPLPIVVGGDFNGWAGAPNFPTYEHMTEYAGYDDSKVIAKVSDDSGTARVFGKDILGSGGTDANGIRIDFLFTQGVEVSRYEVAKGTFDEGADHSYCEYSEIAVTDGSQYDFTDHLPVYIRAKVNAQSCSVPPTVKMNAETADDVIVTEEGDINAIATKIVFDSTLLLDYVGQSINNCFDADIVESDNGKCLRIMAKYSYVQPRFSIDYRKLMTALGLTGVSADNYKKIKIEYYTTLSLSSLDAYFGASTVAMPDVVANESINSKELTEVGEWKTQVLDFSASEFWVTSINSLVLTSSSGFLGGDAVYIKSIELLP